MNKLQREIFEMEQELGVPSHLRWHNSKYTALLEQVGTKQECDGNILTCLNEKCICKHNKIMEKETVEDAAEKYAMETYGSIELKDYTPEMKLNYARLATAYKQGTEWQQEQNGLTPNDLIEFSKWVNKMGYSHRLTLIPNDLIDFYLKNKENIIKLNLE
jgi:hypothetical protein